ncbi:hypothetical protein CHGG_08151 [Chaetomium globosum CBS 148.51]|uniref:CobW C-terminal domain-containing protein n=1 Tax=Chaetomium globosum (strain ATCC 6205 / CBS 148.51 / DSM 1962 / NBRC 6347 / NRRL 1970) TaxID=306901 RepID=Q2GV53_CHAGB|nr:uncharacterized protein CHGG_08151 [Chaetomium globosum CBS 148.51]EAQ86898.1 hypothetical protein CHGG_08151 [Chaetomium globosum CBS 148.51]
MAVVGMSRRNGSQPKGTVQYQPRLFQSPFFLASCINVDASLIKQTHRVTKTQAKVIALQNGCICCTLRGDLLEELLRLAELEQFDYVVVESSGISEPEQVAETFDQRLAEQMAALAGGEVGGLDAEMVSVLERLKAAGGLEKFARLDTTVTVIDAFTIYNDFETDDMLIPRRDDVQLEDERTVSDLMVDQIEFADVIVLNKMDLVGGRVLEEWVIKMPCCLRLILEASYGRLEVREILNTGIFSLERAQTGYGWLQDLHAMTLQQVNGRKVITPKPETEEYNIRNFVYTRTRPFHPQRLFELLHDKFILQLEVPDDDDDSDSNSDDSNEGDSASDSDSNTAMEDDDDDDDEEEDEDAAATTSELSPPPNDTILRNKRAHPLFRRLFRSKGEFLLATRPQRAGEWSQAGAMLTLAGGRPWFCTLPREHYVTGDAEVDRLVAFDVARGGQWGDRRQEIVFIGEGLDEQGLAAVLDACLLTDGEWEAWEEVMREVGLGEEERVERLRALFEDGWPDWSEDAAHDHDHGDGEGHEGHGCE